MRRHAPLIVLLLIGAVTVLAVPGRALLPDRTLLPLDFLHEALLPWANNIQSPAFKDQYEIDAIQEYLPLYHFQAESLRTGEFPTWNPFNRGGAAYPDNPVPVPFHPLKLLLRFLSPEQVYDLTAVVHFGLAFLAMTFYLRSLRLVSPAVFFGALCWTFSAFFVFNFVHERMIGTLGLLPLCLLQFERLYMNPTPRTTAQFGGLLGLSFLIAGPTAILVYLIVFSSRVFGYSLVEGLNPGWKRVRALGGAGLLAFALAAPNLLSTIEGLSQNVRAFDYHSPYTVVGSTLTAIGGYAAIVLSAVHPYAFGSRASVDLLKVVGHTVTLIPFAGSFTLIFALFSARFLWADRHLRWMVIVLAVGLILLLPPVAAVLSTRNVILLTLVLVVGGAIGMHRFWTALSNDLQRSGRLLVIFAIAAWVIFLLREAIFVAWGDQLLRFMRIALESRLPGYLLERYAQWKIHGADRFLALQHVWSLPNLLFLFGLSALAISWRRYSLTGNRTMRAGVLGVAALAPLAFAFGNVNVVDTRLYPIPAKPEYLALRGRDPGPPRIAIPLQGINDRLLMPALLPQLFDLAQVRGYGSLLSPSPAVLTRDLPLSHPLYAVLGVNYLLTARDSPAQLAAYPRTVHSGEINIYAREPLISRFHVVDRLLRVGSRAEAIDRARSDARPVGQRSYYLTELPSQYVAEAKDLTGNVKVLADGPKYIEAEASVDRAALLVVGDTYYPGWRAYVDGAPTQIYCVDGAIQGVWLPAGPHKIVLQYVHWPSRIGIALQLTALLALALTAHLFRRKRPAS